MYIALVVAIVAGIIIGLIEMHKGRKGAHLQGLQDDEIPCTEAFENLKVVNAWQKNNRKKDTINKKTG